MLQKKINKKSEGMLQKINNFHTYVVVYSKLLASVSEVNTKETEIRSKTENNDHTHIHPSVLIHNVCMCVCYTHAVIANGVRKRMQSEIKCTIENKFYYENKSPTKMLKQRRKHIHMYIYTHIYYIFIINACVCIYYVSEHIHIHICTYTEKKSTQFHRQRKTG